MNAQKNPLYHPKRKTLSISRTTNTFSDIHMHLIPPKHCFVAYMYEAILFWIDILLVDILCSFSWINIAFLIMKCIFWLLVNTWYLVIIYPNCMFCLEKFHITLVLSEHNSVTPNIFHLEIQMPIATLDSNFTVRKECITM